VYIYFARDKKFQFLIGKLKSLATKAQGMEDIRVSIPHRYTKIWGGVLHGEEKVEFQFLIGKLKSIHVLGDTQTNDRFNSS